MDLEEDLLVWVMAAVDVGLQDIGDHVCKNMVHRYRVCMGGSPGELSKELVT